MADLPAKVCALVVAYHPDRAKLERLIGLIALQVGRVVVLDNGSSDEVREVLRGYPEVLYQSMEENVGLGGALNRGVLLAGSLGCDYVVTFDHDSAPAPDMVLRLLEALRELKWSGRSVAAVGPAFVDYRQSPPLRYPFVATSGWRVRHLYAADGAPLPVDQLITSGCLYPLEVFEGVGLFNEELFIDYVDTEWCFRARSRGYSLFGVTDAVMSHELGEGEVTISCGMRLIEYTPLRRYYYYRNTVHFVRLPYVPWVWRVRLSLGLLARALFLPVSPGRARCRQLQMMTRGILAGVAGVTGKVHSG
ncbi:glycosyltransferase family 2 protein [Geomonas sp. RF6]|uniref:glycosyltransferase family 2 protein n=1 Tax=Geomonas sp. RF6 TaxID=2897342 RepID=UPI001E3363BD|nr:glycosyltransferase family 2 protein [Geomonas sp. RF6]UFS71304.1 glycosyltransferase family 2 protein [Geomonas sp. RF6]